MGSGYTLFMSEFVRTFKTTGSIAPSSRWLARSLTRHMLTKNVGQPRRILEVGPGTGAVTTTLVQRLAPRDSLVLVELNERFVSHLHDRFHHEPHFNRVLDRTEIIHDRLENLPSGSQFDLIVSGLPLNNFSVKSVEEILGQLEHLLADGGILTFFEYMAVRTARGVVSLGAERRRVQGISRAMRDVFRRYKYQREWVWRNIPPAWVHHVMK